MSTIPWQHGYINWLVQKKKEKGITVILQWNMLGHFLWLFIGLPIVLHVGQLMLLIVIADRLYYKASSFNSIILSLCWKNGYGKSVLLYFSVIPEENIHHLGWTVKSNLFHSLSFAIPLFTNKWKLLSAAIGFLNGKHLLN